MSIFGALKKNKKKEEEKKIQETKKETSTKKDVLDRVALKNKKTEQKAETKSKKDILASEEKLKRSPKAKKNKATVQNSDAWKVLASPHVTEKASRLAEENQYIFRVFPRAKKIEIKKAVEDIYGVKTEAVRIINVLPRKRRVGKTTGMTKGYKKAIVKIAKGQEIEILPR